MLIAHTLSRAERPRFLSQFKLNQSLTSSPSLRIVTLWPWLISFLARCSPRKAWPPPLVLAMRTESARQTRELRRAVAAAEAGRAEAREARIAQKKRKEGEEEEKER